MTTTRFATCNLCEACCGLELTVAGGRVESVRGDGRDPLSRGHLCPKAVALPDVHADGERLRTPVRRTADGWEAISWEAAFDLVATRLADVRDRHGRDAVGVYLGNPTVHSLGALTHGTGFMGMLRTRNRFSATSVDQLPHHLVAYLLYGHQLMLPIPDLDRTDHFLVIGGNPMASNGSLMTVPDFARRRRALAERGGRMVVVDPRRTETAKVADEHHFVRPGTDAALLLAMVRTILAEDSANPPSYVDGIDVVREAVEGFTPEWAAPITGIDASTTERLAREFAGARSAVCYGRTGVSMQQHGAVCQWAIQVLNVLTGNIDRPGGALVTKPAVDVLKMVSPGHFGAWRSRVRGLPEFAGELPVAVLAEEIETPGDKQIKAFVVNAGNPVLSTPDGPRLAKALAGLDFMVAVDVKVNETTRHADVILPPTPLLERDHYDIIFNAFAVRDTARFAPAVLPKPEEARHDWEIFRELGLRYRKRFKGKRFDTLRLRLSPRVLLDVLLRTGPHRLSVRKLRKNPNGVDLGPLKPSFPQRLRTEDKRIDLAPKLVLDGLGAVCELRAGDGLLLIGRRHLRANNSWMNDVDRLTRGKARHHLLMHPRDLAEHGITDGAEVRVRSAVGEVRVPVTSSDEVMPGVVSLPHGYRAASANDLTDPAVLDGVSGNAVLNGVPVRVEAVGPAPRGVTSSSAS
ncbi:molybdopterin-dependent oxidoreductase [Actinokineospora spheciospongiae]|uniref:molybdopterin-dependent oxidoreductase n=1 Tax=Actinokineospora spheciospongiae TaxID=909613 RepID=UPI000D70CC14|nr:molybdopterin-dependent oxidoreductase [Actinokineospora spheciospongiae]PWW64552.1 anaerobic selenocysteine-containing dehydrogenase [Actinokineospora spheciospongiae]